MDTALLERGWAPTLQQAQALILAGRIRYHGHPETHVGTQIPDPEALELVPASPYVSRGGEKLAGALKETNISVAGRLCLDIGASTGGFTDCLLQAGARHVQALDVGAGLLDIRLRHDPRVTVLERVNMRHFDPNTLAEKPSFVTVDVSFISLEKLLPKIHQVLLPDGEALVLVKPQFEASRKDAPKGIVKDETVRQSLIDKVQASAETIGFRCKGRMNSVLEGTKGNREAFLYLGKL